MAATVLATLEISGNTSIPFNGYLVTGHPLIMLADALCESVHNTYSPETSGVLWSLSKKISFNSTLGAPYGMWKSTLAGALRFMQFCLQLPSFLVSISTQYCMQA